MLKPKMLLSLFLLVFLLAFPSLFAQETITITTYYPSPYGSYGYLHTDKFGVGDNDGSGGPTEADIPITSGHVWIAGNVGIGTTGPATKLHINTWDGSTVPAGYNQMVKLTGGMAGNNTQGHSIDFGVNAGNEYPHVRIVGTMTDGSGGELQFFTTPNYITTPSSARMTINDNGNVGIGTTNPTQKLTLNTGQILVGVTGSSGDASIYLRGGATGDKARITLNHYGTADYQIAVGDVSGKLSLTKTTGGSDGIIIDSSGNVGIGTTGPSSQSRLHVVSPSVSTAAVTAEGGYNSVGEIQNTGLRILSTADVSTGDYVGLTFSGNKSAPGRSRAGVGAKFINGASASDLVFMTRYALDGTELSSSDIKMTITSGGYVGIGTTAPYSELHVNGNIAISGNPGSTRYLLLNETNTGSTQLIMQAGAGSATYGGGINVYGHSHATRPGWVVAGISNGSGGKFSVDNSGTGGTSVFNVDASGNVTGTYGNYHVSSDIRLKKDIVTIPNALEKVLSLRGVNFRWKDSKPDDNLHMGMIAQEVEKVVPEVVHTADDEMKTKAVEYQYFVGLLVEAIKAQQKEIGELKLEIASLKGKL